MGAWCSGEPRCCTFCPVCHSQGRHSTWCSCAGSQAGRPLLGRQQYCRLIRRHCGSPCSSVVLGTDRAPLCLIRHCQARSVASVCASSGSTLDTRARLERSVVLSGQTDSGLGPRQWVGALLSAHISMCWADGRRGSQWLRSPGCARRECVVSLPRLACCHTCMLRRRRAAQRYAWLLRLCACLSSPTIPAVQTLAGCAEALDVAAPAVPCCAVRGWQAGCWAGHWNQGAAHIPAELQLAPCRSRMTGHDAARNGG